jgi:HK97 family phage major capsid protein
MKRHPNLDMKASAGDFGRPAYHEVRDAFEDFMRGFEVFKDANDRRLSEIERRSSDALTVEKVERLNAALDDQKQMLDTMALAMSRPEIGGFGPIADPSARTHKGRFDSYVRRGDEQGLRTAEVKALSTQSDPDGGYLVPAETERQIDRGLTAVSPIRAIASVRQIGASIYKKPFTVNGPATGWVGETETRPETQAPTLAELTFPAMELYAMPAATQTLLDDAIVDIGAWLAEEVLIAFAEQEGAAFVAGDGINKPRGFLSYPTVDNAAWGWGNIGTVSTGVDGALPASNPADVLIDLVYAVRQGYRANARWVMNRQVQSELRKLKDSGGNYLWQPGLHADAPATLLGFPITEREDMPDMAANSLSVAFGDFRRGYLVVDRMGVRVLRDPYTAKPYVLFYTTKRVGGGVQDFDAIKLLKFSL